MRLFPNIVLKHEGNMPFENDGLRGWWWCRDVAGTGYIIPFYRKIVSHTAKISLLYFTHNIAKRLSKYCYENHRKNRTANMFVATALLVWQAKAECTYDDVLG